ncbi:MAG: hypothetical protein A2X88_07060 [Deltaproteobacteria bacterium GWC2_65_14]|nr:MAG: hypothetical protein A2X88_07060 [Deltaproteobacteria bacterium GWC2_65_14]
MNYHWNWGIFLEQIKSGDETYLSWLITGLGWTVAVSIASWVIAFLLGSMVGTARTTPRRWLVRICNGYVELFRNIPLLVQMFLWFFVVIPMLIGKPVGAERSALITFTAFEAAYYSEIMRAGIQSVAQGQVMAGYALGMTYWQMMALVVLPQAFRNMLPVLLTQTIILFQDTSLVYAIGAKDLLKAAEISGKNYNRPTEMTMMVVTHEMGFERNVAHRVIFM